MQSTGENRAARDIVASMGEKVLFAYLPEVYHTESSGSDCKSFGELLATEKCAKEY